MNFGDAIEALKLGMKAKRKGWNGKHQYLVLIKPHEYNPNNDLVPAGPEKHPWIGLLTEDYKFVPWTASQVDILAEDWESAA